MGCGCGNKPPEKPKGFITQAKVIVRKALEASQNTQLQEKPVTVTKINKT
jgi:hypothetical protein